MLKLKFWTTLLKRQLQCDGNRNRFRQWRWLSQNTFGEEIVVSYSNQLGSYVLRMPSSSLSDITHTLKSSFLFTKHTLNRPYACLLQNATPLLNAVPFRSGLWLCIYPNLRTYFLQLLRTHLPFGGFFFTYTRPHKYNVRL